MLHDARALLLGKLREKPGFYNVWRLCLATGKVRQNVNKSLRRMLREGLVKRKKRLTASYHKKVYVYDITEAGQKELGVWEKAPWRS